MRRRKRSRIRSALGLASVAALGAAAGANPALAQERAGVAGAVVPQASATRPGAAQQTLAVGAELVRNERIATDASGRAHLLFLDQTAVTLGPSTDLTIDEFVYNPAQDVGSASVTVGRGVMRFVGGRLSKQQDATIRTPVATIGVRGAIAITEVLPNLSTLVLFVYGDRLSIRSSTGATRVLTQPGLAIVVAANGEIGNPVFPRPEELDRLLVLLGPPSGRDGPGVPGFTVPPVAMPPGGYIDPRRPGTSMPGRPTPGY